MGSRGTRTYSAPPPTSTAPKQAQPMQRSMTQPTQPQAAPRPATGLAQPSFFERHPFVGGLMGGLIGAGIAGMLFGHGFFGADGFGFAGVLGLVLQLALIFFLVHLFLGWLRSRSGASGSGFGFAGAPQTAGGPAAGLAALGNRFDAANSGPAGAAVRDEIGIGQPDLDAFERRLREVQQAWSDEDLAGLRRLATPEMVHYFAEDLAANASRGVVNKVAEVKLLQGDLSEAWRDGGIEYATVAMRWSAVDYLADAKSGRPVQGDPGQAKENTEVWTFMRSHGGDWLLSAIQQV
jgi:predicted lipid-binding transport protein (Tim44 family)